MATALGAFTFNVGAWDYEGHHMVNELALASLPKDFGIDMTPALKGRVAFLAGDNAGDPGPRRQLPRNPIAAGDGAQGPRRRLGRGNPAAA